MGNGGKEAFLRLAERIDLRAAEQTWIEGAYEHLESLNYIGFPENYKLKDVATHARFKVYLNTFSTDQPQKDEINNAFQAFCLIAERVAGPEVALETFAEFTEEDYFKIDGVSRFQAKILFRLLSNPQTESD